MGDDTNERSFEASPPMCGDVDSDSAAPDEEFEASSAWTAAWCRRRSTGVEREATDGREQ